VLFSQPCCPTGVVYSEAEIVQLSDALTEAEARFGTAVYAISDEVHRHLVWGADTVSSPLNSYARSVIIYSFGKALSLQGQGIGYIAVSPRMPENEELRARIEQCVRLMGFGNPTSLMQHAVCDLLEYEPDLQPLAASQALVRRTLAAYGYDVCDGQASFYVYVKSPLLDDFRCAELLAAHGVLVAPSTLFHEPGYIRLSLTAQPGRIAAALPAFERILDNDAGGVKREQTWSHTC
jgi:aspartate aminotransferase